MCIRDRVQAARDHGVNIWRVDDDHVSLSVDETTTDADLDAVLAALGAERRAESAPVAVSGELARTSAVLTHPVFNTHHSETAMLRYVRALADKDFALDRGMIPLGSCTMKLNATTEMAAVTWPEFARLHPVVPAEQSAG